MAGVEHDIKNRLAVALGYAQLLSRSELTQTQRSWVDHILAACDGEERNCLRDLAGRLGVGINPRCEDDVFAGHEIEGLFDRALTVLTDRRHGLSTVTLSTVRGPDRCSHCGAVIDRPGYRLFTGSRLPGAVHAWRNMEQDCVSAHMTFEHEADGMSVTIYPKGAVDE